MSESLESPAWKHGCVQIYTGDGKGKTTAALGLALRAAGAGLPVYIAQFLKARQCSEHNSLRRFEELITCEQFGSGKWICRDGPSAEDIACAERGLEAARSALVSGDYRVVILDEINCALGFTVLSLQAVRNTVATKPANVELILTGRNAPQELLEQADLVTEMKLVKHYHAQGLDARTGIEM